MDLMTMKVCKHSKRGRCYLSLFFKFSSSIKNKGDSNDNNFIKIWKAKIYLVYSGFLF